MTGWYVPASISALMKRMSFFVGIELGNLTLLPPALQGRRAVDQDHLPFPRTYWPQARQGIERAVADRRRLLEAHADRLERDSGILPHAHELRVCPEPHPSRAEHLVAHGELADRRADSFDNSRELAAEDPPPRSADTKDEAADE